MMSDKNLLDLCALNLMEEHIEKSHTIDRETALKAIEWKKKETILKLSNDPSPIAPKAMEQHIKNNTAEDGIYPWTESPQFKGELPNLIETDSDKLKINSIIYSFSKNRRHLAVRKRKRKLKKKGVPNESE